MIQHRPNRSLADLGRISVGSLAHIGPFLSGVGASGKPGVVQLKPLLDPERFALAYAGAAHAKLTSGKVAGTLVLDIG